MEQINKVKSISIWIFIVPFIAVNTCLVLITQFHEIFPNQEDIIHNTIPYIDGGASISRTARPYPSWLIFKPAMFLTSFLLIKYWLFNRSIVSFFDKDHKRYGENLIFTDCAMNISPSSDELAEIACNAYKTAQSFLDEDPKLAMLSFSTNQSAKHSEVDKVRQATKIVRSRLPSAQIIGNVQLDAALDSEVLKIKDSDSSFPTPANVFVFPNLDAGNIGYKLVQRFSGAKAIGPILQGLSKPVNDLSRGCSVDEIVNTVVVTANQVK